MNFLDLLDALNWIDRIPAWLTGIAIGGRHTFVFDRSKVNEKHAEDLLKKYDMKMFGLRVTSKTAMFSVPKTRAKEAEYYLLRAGMAPISKPVNPKNAGWASRHTGPAPAWKDRKRGNRERID